MPIPCSKAFDSSQLSTRLNGLLLACHSRPSTVWCQLTCLTLFSLISFYELDDPANLTIRHTLTLSGFCVFTHVDSFSCNSILYSFFTCQEQSHTPRPNSHILLSISSPLIFLEKKILLNSCIIYHSIPLLFSYSLLPCVTLE